MDALVLASSLALAVAADDVRATEHRQLAPVVLAGVALDRADLLGSGLEVGQPGVDQVAVARGELTTGAARAGVHDHRVGALQRLGVRATPLEVEVAAVELALALDGPQLLQQRRPLVGHRVAIVVLAPVDPEHGELLGVPAGDDVQAPASTGNVVGGGAHLGREQRMADRDVERREHHDPAGDGE